MKKLICIILAVVTLFACSACSSRMDGISDDAYEYGLSALETADEFIAGEIDADTAQRRLDLASGLAEDCGGTNDFLVSSNIFLISSAVGFKDRGSGTMKEVKDRRNDLADILGK